MELIPVLEILNIVTYKSVDKEKIKINYDWLSRTDVMKQRNNESETMKCRTCWPQVQSCQPYGRIPLLVYYYSRQPPHGAVDYKKTIALSGGWRRIVFL